MTQPTASDNRDASMPDVALGLAIAFYLYPCGLFIALFSSQLYRYRYRDADDPLAAINEKKDQKAHRLYVKLLWMLQLLLSVLLVCLS